MEGGFVADGECVVPGGDGAVALGAVAGALDCVALLVWKRLLGYGTCSSVGPFILLRSC